MTAADGLAYNPATDRIIVRTTTATAQQFSISFVPFTASSPDFVIVSGLGKSITFNDPGGFRGETDMTFPDGSLLFAGSVGNDSQPGTTGADGIFGSFGNDTLTGLAGNDLLHGNQGDDN